MTRQAHKFLIKIRAGFGVLAILISSLAAPAVLALQTDDNICASEFTVQRNQKSANLLALQAKMNLRIPMLYAKAT